MSAHPFRRAGRVPPLSGALKIAYRPITALRLDASNPRQHPERQLKALARSIQTFGFNVPVLVDRQDRVIAGHARCLAAQRLGWVEVPTLMLEHLSEAQASAYRIADNRLTEQSTWDELLLGAEFARLAALDLDFSLEVTGFDIPAIDLLIEGATSGKTAEDAAADTLPAMSGPTVSRVGDLWQLGPHRVLCGNALIERYYRQLLGRQRAGVVFTDPPYNVPIAGHVSGLGRVQHADFAMAVGEMSPEDFTDFLRQVMRLLTSYSRAGSVHYLCMDWRHLLELMSAAEGVYAEQLNLCVWAKDNGGMGSLYRSQHELIAVFKHGRGAHRNNVELGKHGRYRTNVWRYPGANSFGGRQSDEGSLLALHPTVKPVALVADALLDVSARGDGVLDPFLGSGTTVMAAERVGRVCHGIELEPRYVDCIVQRWQRYTGERALCGKTGVSFDDVADMRGDDHVSAA